MIRCAREDCRRWRPTTWLALRRHRGVWFEDEWYCSPACFEALTRDRLLDAGQPERTRVVGASMKLGAILLARRTITAAALRDALRLQAASGLRLGDQLQAMGAAAREDVLRALGTQAGTGYLTHVDPVLVRDAPGGLSREAVRTLGVVPFDINRETERLKVACPAPLPRLALAALRELTGYAVQPLIVPDDIAAMLIEEYGTAPTLAPIAVTHPRSLREAGSHIVSTVFSGRAQRLQYARCDAYIWVRLDGEHSEELSLPVACMGGGRTELDFGKDHHAWQAEPMPL